MTAAITIARMEGPTRNSHDHCGVKFVSAGFIQNGNWPLKRGLYNDSTPAVSRRSSLESEPQHVDYTTGSTPPWYHSGTALVAPSVDALLTSQAITINDTPSLTGTDRFTLDGDQVDELQIEHAFGLYVAVHTRDSRNNASAVYTQRGAANWTFDGSGSVDAAGVYTSAGGNTGSGSFTEVSSGAIVPVTTGSPCNAMYASQTWTTF